MTRQYSPRYPNAALDEAIASVRRVFENDRTNPIDRSVAAKHIGYSGISGASDKALSTLTQYGLLERGAKGEISVSQLALNILEPDPTEPGQRQRALFDAAHKPAIFRQIRERFNGDVSAEALRSWLIREGFNDRAIGPTIKSYTKTFAFLKQEGASEIGDPSVERPAESDPPTSSSDGGPAVKGEQFGGARVGDLIQWESQGALQFGQPRRVRDVSNDGNWVAVEGSETGLPMSEVIVKQASPHAPPPVFPEPPTRHEVAPDANEWFRSRVGEGTAVAIKATGPMGPKEIGKLIKLLEAQKAVLED